MKLRLNPATTAVVWIDLQRAIVDRSLAPRSGRQVVQTCAAITQRARAAGAMIVYVHVDLANILQLPVDQPSRDPSAPPPPPEASQIVPDAGMQPGDLVILKRQWSAFGGTNLHAKLRERGIQTIVLGGIATNFGVESTARAAASEGFALVVVEDAMATFSESAHRFVVETIFPRIARVRSADQIDFATA